MGKKAAKSTKKFGRKHLKTAIEKRRKLKPLKNALRRKQAALEERRRRKADEENGSAAKKKKVEEMNVDELMNANFLDDEIDFDKKEEASEDEGIDSEDSLPEVEEEDFVDVTPEGVDDDEEDSEDDEDGSSEIKAENKKFKSEIEKHKKDLEKLKEKDPEFYQFLKEHDEELLEFDDEDKDDEKEAGPKPVEKESISLTGARVDTWFATLRERESYVALRMVLKAFRNACHYGEGNDEELADSFAITSSQVFNKVMVFVLSEVDGIFKKMLHISRENMSGQDLKSLTRWKKLFPFVKSYLTNALHVLNQMTDNRMISYTLRRLRPSIIFLREFPTLARRYMKALLHFWTTGEDVLSFIAFTVLRDMAIYLGTDCLDSCTKAVYKHFVANARSINAKILPRLQFMANCVVELYGIDMAVSYQNAFSFIKQMALILRSAVTVKTKDAFKKVYCWQYMSSLELWVKVVSGYPGKDNLEPLAYPLAQIIGGVSRLVPTPRYFPLRMQCAVLLNRLASATSMFIPVASALLDMLEFKELSKPPTGGAGSGLDFQLILKVPKPSLKTRAFQEECVLTVLEQLTEHLTQWSYSIAFPELALIPLLQLRHFSKDTNVDRFRRVTRQLVEQIERNVEFVSRKRDGVSFSPKDIEAVAAFLKAEKEAGSSPLSQYCNVLRQRAKERKQTLKQSSVIVKEREKPPAEQDDDAGAEKLFNKKWHQEKKIAGSALKVNEEKAEEGNAMTDASEEDVVEDLLLSSEEDSDEDDEGADAGGDEVSLSSDEQPTTQRVSKNPKKQKKRKQQQGGGVGGAANGPRKKKQQPPTKKRKARAT